MSPDPGPSSRINKTTLVAEKRTVGKKRKRVSYKHTVIATAKQPTTRKQVKRKILAEENLDDKGESYEEESDSSMNFNYEFIFSYYYFLKSHCKIHFLVIW